MPIIYIQECERARHAHSTAKYFTLLTITGAVYVSEIPAFYDPLILSLRPHQVRTEKKTLSAVEANTS